MVSSKRDLLPRVSHAIGSQVRAVVGSRQIVAGRTEQLVQDSKVVKLEILWRVPGKSHLAQGTDQLVASDERAEFLRRDPKRCTKGCTRATEVGVSAIHR